jgi:pilus assembly protein Flp/PilA
MSKLGVNTLRFLRSEEGPTAVEYAVMLAFVIIALIAVIKSLTVSVNSSFSATASSFS